MYRIMLAKSKREDYQSLYQFMTTTVDGVTSPYEIETKEDLDKKVESMLNEDDYSKGDFIIVEVVDYSIDAKEYTDGEPEEEDVSRGKDGKSAYELAKEANPDVGSLEEWLASLKGKDGINGKNITKIELKTSEDGKVTGGTVTFDDTSTLDITVSEAV